MQITQTFQTETGWRFSARLGGASLAFSVTPDFALTGYVEAFSGDVWPGNYPTYFDSEPVVEDDTCRPPRVRLARRGVEVCLAALAAATGPVPDVSVEQPCDCDLCRWRRVELKEVAA